MYWNVHARRSWNFTHDLIVEREGRVQGDAVEAIKMKILGYQVIH